MGFYFRKSKSIGPFRFNFSKSGIGVSTGVKGARLSVGPRGTYINVGRNGVYYRKKIGTTSKKKLFNSKESFSHNQSANGKTTADDYFVPDAEMDAIRISSDSGQMTETGREIIRNIKRAKILTWIWWILLFIALGYGNGWAFLLILIARVAFKSFFRAEIAYELDEETREKWENAVEQLAALRKSKKVWIIETSSFNANTKINAGASRNLTRTAAKLKVIKANRKTKLGVTSGEESFLISSPRCKILFLPSEVLIRKGMKFVAYAYGDIDFRCSTTNFIENGFYPRDAEVIKYTWQYVNLDGTADKRYKNNRQFPVCKYGLIHLTAGNDLNIEIHVSNHSIVKEIGNVCSSYNSFLNSEANKIKTHKSEQQSQKNAYKQISEDNLPKELFDNDVIKNKESDGTLKKEFSDFMKFEDDGE